MWKPFFHIFIHGDVVNAQTWEVSPQNIQSSHLNIIGIKYFYLSLSIFISYHLFIFFKAKTFDADVKQKMNQAQVPEPKVRHFVLANYQRYIISKHRPKSEVRINKS